MTTPLPCTVLPPAPPDSNTEQKQQPTVVLWPGQPSLRVSIDAVVPRDEVTAALHEVHDPKL